MRRSHANWWALVLLTGCGFNPGTNENAQRQKTPQEPSSQPAASVAGDAEQLPAGVADLVRAAAEAESAEDYANAALLRRDIREKLIAQRGADHWLVANCDLAIASDERMAELVDSDKADLRKLSDLQQQAAGYAKRGATRQALECIGQARTIAERLFGPLAILPLRLQLASGQSNEQLGRWDEAKQDFAQVAERARKMFASPHPDLEAALFHGGIIERQLGNLDRAIELLTQSKEMTEKLYGRHAAFAARSNDLAVALHRGGRNEEALRELALAEDLRRSQLGGQHPLVAECLLNQGAVLIDQQNWKAARDKLQAAESICDANSGAVTLGHEVRQQLATLDVIEKDFASAARRLTKALETEAKQSNRYSPQYASLAYRLALSLAFQRDFKQAEPLLRHALSVQRNLLGPSHDQTQKTLQALAQLLERTERAAEAKTLREQNSYTVAQDPGETSQ